MNSFVHYAVVIWLSSATSMAPNGRTTRLWRPTRHKVPLTQSNPPCANGSTAKPKVNVALRRRSRHRSVKCPSQDGHFFVANQLFWVHGHKNHQPLAFTDKWPAPRRVKAWRSPRPARRIEVRIMPIENSVY